MVSSEAARNHLYARVAEVLDPEAAETLMKLLPTVPMMDLATKTDLLAVKTDLHAVKTDLHAVKTDLHAVKNDLHAVKTDLHAVKNDLHAVKTELKEEIGGLRGEMQSMFRTMIGATLGGIFLVLSAMVGAAATILANL